MKPRMSRIASVALAIGMVALLLLVASDPALAQGKKTFTAQSGMLTIDLPQTSFVVTGSFTYQYDQTCADTFITCTKTKFTWSGTSSAPNTTCSGTASSSTSQSVTGIISQWEQDNKCNFFNDNTLTDPSDAGSCQATGNSSKKTVVACTVDNTTTRTGFVDPGDVVTCWDLTSTTGSLPTITPLGTAASESALCSSKHPLKYSFTLGDPLSSNGTRVTGLTATLKDKDGAGVKNWSEADGNLTVGLPAGNTGLDFMYNGANGANGTFSILTSSGPGYNSSCSSEPAFVNDIQGGFVSACGTVPTGCATTDQFLGNDGVGGDLATYEALVASPGLAPEGSPYSLSVAATLKSSVAGLVSLPLSVCAQVTVNAGSCLNTSTTCP